MLQMQRPVAPTLATGLLLISTLIIISTIIRIIQLARIRSKKDADHDAVVFTYHLADTEDHTARLAQQAQAAQEENQEMDPPSPAKPDQPNEIVGPEVTFKQFAPNAWPHGTQLLIYNVRHSYNLNEHLTAHP